MKETIEQQQRDSDMIFTQISTSGIDNYGDAEKLIASLYIFDMSISRSGISDALKRLEMFYLK